MPLAVGCRHIGVLTVVLLQEDGGWGNKRSDFHGGDVGDEVGRCWLATASVLTGRRRQIPQRKRKKKRKPKGCRHSLLALNADCWLFTVGSEC